MSFPGPFVHDIDPVIGTILGVHLWWYGLSYTLGFLNAHTFTWRRRGRLGLSMTAVYDLSLLIAASVLIGGRAVEVVFYEWPFYSENLHLIPAYWLGGMASHGLLAGGLAAVWIFCRIYDKPFLVMTDALAIPATFILGMGRIGNFIDGQILGSETSMPWGVKFPDAEGFRHPVVLYDGIKNLLIIPVLLYIGKKRLPAGVQTGVFLFLYSFLRIPIDVYREYPTSLWGLATGQVLNILMSAAGILLVIVVFRRAAAESGGNIPEYSEPVQVATPAGKVLRMALFASLLLFSLTMPSDWTQDIPERYGTRHSCLTYSAIYPRIDPWPD